MRCRKKKMTRMEVEDCFKRGCSVELRYGVDEFEYDSMATMTRDPDEIVTEDIPWTGTFHSVNREFRCPCIRWKVNGQWFAAAIPVKLRLLENTYELDYDEMELELRKLIEESKEKRNDNA